MDKSQDVLFCFSFLMRHLKTSFVLIFEGIVLCGALILLAGIMLAGRLMMGPLKVTELTPVFERILSQPDQGLNAKIAISALTWDKDRRSVVLELNNIHMVDGMQQTIATIPKILLVLRPMGYFDESHSPWNVVIQKPHMHMRLDAAGALHLGVWKSDDVAVMDPEKQSDISIEDIKVLLRDSVQSSYRRSAGLGLFANVSVLHAGVTLIDEGRQITWNAEMPELSFKRIKNDYAGKAKLMITKNNMQTTIDVALSYTSASKVFTAVGSFDHLNPTLFAGSISQLKPFDFIASPLTGSVSVSIDPTMHVIEGGMNINLDKGEIKIPDLYTAPLPFQSGQIVARYNKSDTKLRLETLRIDFEHMVLQGEAAIQVGASPRDVTATFKVSDVAVKNLPALWPESVGKNARDWLLENIHKGHVDEVVLNLGLSVPENDVAAATLKDVHGSLKLSGGEMTCWHAIPNLEKLSATGTFNEKGFDLQVLSGEYRELKIKPSHVVITGLDKEVQTITVDANLVSPAPLLLSILDRPPMGYATKMTIKPAETSGMVEGLLHISLPLLKDLSFDQIELNANAKVTDGAVPKVAGLIDVTKGAVELYLDKKALAFNGDTTLNGVPAKVDWKENFVDGTSHAVVTGNIKAEDIKRFGFDLMMRSAERFPVEVFYDRAPTLSKLVMMGDAQKTTLEIPQVFYKKPAGDALHAALTLKWGDAKPMQLSELKVTGTHVTVMGQGSFDTSQHLAQLTLSPFQMGATQGHVAFQRGKDGVPFFALKGDVLDIRQQFDGEVEDKPASTPLQIDMQFKRVLTGAKTELNNLNIKGVRDSFGWSMFEVNATAKNKTPFNFTVRPINGRSALSMTTPNLGNVLAALDVTDTMIGGKLTIDGKSEPNDKLRNIFGHIKLENFRVKNMPALAQLINAISPDGLAAMLGGDGLGFSDLTGEYVWQRDAIVISKAHTSSGSLGLTAAGKIDLQRSAVELEGQVIPVYFISRILSAIPIIGDVLTGGEGQGLFAATYRVEGPLSKAKVSVNPVSVLAPGILRNILFMDKDIGKTDKARGR